MPSFIISMHSSKINWADDDDDDFDFEAWKATADISAPPPSSLPPLQLPSPAPEPTYTTGDESAPWALSTPIPPPTHHEKQKVDWSSTDFRCAKPMLAWRGVDKEPDPPAYREMGDYWGRRKCYAQTWAYMKAGSGRDCRFTVQFRGSGLRVLEVIVEEEEVDEEVQEDVGVVEQEVDEVVQQDIEVEVKQEFEIPLGDLALEEKEEFEILPGDLAPIAPPEELMISSTGTIDLAPSSTIPSPSPSDLNTSLANSLADLIAFKDAQHEGYSSNRPASPPVSPPLTSVSLLPAAVYAKPSRKHERRDSQEALADDGKTSGPSSNVNGDLDDTELDYGGSIVPLHDIEGIQDAASLGCKEAYSSALSAQTSSAATPGCYHASSMSWMTVALITAGVLAGGAMCFARRH